MLILKNLPPPLNATLSILHYTYLIELIETEQVSMDLIFKAEVRLTIIVLF